MHRLERDRPSLTPHDHLTPKEILRSLTSPHVLLLFIVFFMLGTTLYGLALFLPSIVNQLGFSPTRTQLMSVGPFAASFFRGCPVIILRFINLTCLFILEYWTVTLVSAYLSDRYNSRAIPTAIIATIAVIGYALYLSSSLNTLFTPPLPFPPPSTPFPPPNLPTR